MIITHIIGGLGNQMFQYAIARCLSIKNNDELKLDTGEALEYKTQPYLLDRYGFTYDIATEHEISEIKRKNKTIWEKVFSRKRTYYHEDTLLYDPDVFKLKGDIYLMGYWQCEKYFKEIRQTILDDFSIKKFNEANKKMMERIRSSQSISLHVRRGDYVNNANTQAVHGSCTLEYYARAVDYMAERVDDPTYFLFSDDPDWVKQNLKIEKGEVVCVDINDRHTGHMDMQLMSKCKHNIIANSSFSWWGAWLNSNNDKTVIAPIRWFADDKWQAQASDIVPADWIRM